MLAGILRQNGQVLAAALPGFLAVLVPVAQPELMDMQCKYLGKLNAVFKITLDVALFMP